MITPTWVLLGVVLPAVIGVVVPLVACFCHCPRWLANIVLVIAVALGFEVGFFATYGWPKIPPVEAHEWLLVVLRPAALAVAILVAATRTPIAIIWILRTIIAFGAAPLLLQPYIEHTWTGAQSAKWLAGIGIAAMLFWVLLLRLTPNGRTAEENENHSTSWSCWALAIVAGGTGVTILMSGSQTLGQLGISLAAVLIGVAVAFLITRKSIFLSTSHLDLTITLLIGIWLCGYFYAQLSPVHVILLALAPQAAWVGHLIGPKQGLRTALVRLIPVMILVMIVVGLAVMKFTQESAYDSYGSY